MVALGTCKKKEGALVHVATSGDALNWPRLKVVS